MVCIIVTWILRISTICNLCTIRNAITVTIAVFPCLCGIRRYLISFIVITWIIRIRAIGILCTIIYSVSITVCICPDCICIIISCISGWPARATWIFWISTICTFGSIIFSVSVTILCPYRISRIGCQKGTYIHTSHNIRTGRIRNRNTQISLIRFRSICIAYFIWYGCRSYKIRIWIKCYVSIWIYCPIISIRIRETRLYAGCIRI